MYTVYMYCSEVQTFNSFPQSVVCIFCGQLSSLVYSVWFPKGRRYPQAALRAGHPVNGHKAVLGVARP
jgi:hypothetical protein